MGIKVIGSNTKFIYKLLGRRKNPYAFKYPFVLTNFGKQFKWR